MRLVLRTAPTKQVDGLAVTVTSRDGKLLEIIYAKLDAGLMLLQSRHPSGYRMVKRNVPRVLVGFSPRSKGVWHHRLRLCILSIDFFAQPSATPIDVACALLHEATHGRLEKLGYRYTPERRVRLEAVCTRAEVSLLERLPEAASHRAELERTMTKLSTLYSDANLHYGRVHALRALGAPGWLVRVFDRLHRSDAA